MLLDNPLSNDSRVERAASTLAAWGHAVTVLAFQDAAHPMRESRDGYLINRVIGSDVNRPFAAACGRETRRVCALLAADLPEVLHCHDHRMLHIGAFLKRRHPGLRLVYDAHEYLPGWPYYRTAETSWQRFKGWAVWRRMVADEAWAIRAADHVVTVSESLADEMACHLHLRPRPLVVRNVPRSAPPVARGYLRSRFGVPASHYIAIHVGGVYHTPEHIHMLLEAIQQTPGLHLVFLGSSGTLAGLAAGLEAEQRAFIHFHPAVDSAAVVSHCADADFGIVHTVATRLAFALALPTQ